MSSFDLITQQIYASSAKRPIADETTRGNKSLMYTKNSSEPKTDPCGTPDVTSTTEDIALLTTTHWV